jgi:replication factor A2
LTYSTS